MKTITALNGLYSIPILFRLFGEEKGMEIDRLRTEIEPLLNQRNHRNTTEESRDDRLASEMDRDIRTLAEYGLIEIGTRNGKNTVLLTATGSEVEQFLGHIELLLSTPDARLHRRHY